MKDCHESADIAVCHATIFYNVKIGQLLEPLTRSFMPIFMLEEAAETCYARRRSSLW